MVSVSSRPHGHARGRGEERLPVEGCAPREASVQFAVAIPRSGSPKASRATVLAESRPMTSCS